MRCATKRGTNFEPNEQEGCPHECEELSVKLWKVGITVGLSGLTATAMKVAMIQSCGGIGGCVALQRIRPVQGQRSV